MGRENEKPYSAVIVREGGRSSIPEASVMKSIRRGVLDAPLSRSMTSLDGATVWIASAFAQ
jgi:hypothetical protein